MRLESTPRRPPLGPEVLDLGAALSATLERQEQVDRCFAMVVKRKAPGVGMMASENTVLTPRGLVRLARAWRSASEAAALRPDSTTTRAVLVTFICGGPAWLGCGRIDSARVPVRRAFPWPHVLAIISPRERPGLTAPTAEIAPGHLQRRPRPLGASPGVGAVGDPGDSRRRPPGAERRRRYRARPAWWA